MSDFTSSITDRTVYGDRRVVYGTFFSSGVAGGPVNTLLKRIDYFSSEVYPLNGSTSVSGISMYISGGAANTFPISGGVLEITGPGTNISGIWMAHGK